MNQGIHPNYEKNDHSVAPVVQSLRPVPPKRTSGVEICSKCHPFFTGRQKLVDTGGRVDRFNRRFNRALKRSKSRFCEIEAKAVQECTAFPLPKNKER